MHTVDCTHSAVQVGRVGAHVTLAIVDSIRRCLESWVRCQSPECQLTGFQPAVLRLQTYGVSISLSAAGGVLTCSCVLEGKNDPSV